MKCFFFIFLLVGFVNAEESIFKWNNKDVRFFSIKPKSEAKGTIIVVHGIKRNPEYYFKQASVLNEKLGLGVVAVEISEQNFSGSRNFQFGGVFSDAGNHNEVKDWTLTMMNEFILYLKTLSGFEKSNIFIWGHSAGSQFVHRLAILAPSNTVAKYFACNAGNYTAFDLEVAYPYGIKGVQKFVSKETPKVPLIVLAGDRDNDPDGKYVSKKEGALNQGAHRFERAHYFVNSAKNMNYENWPTLVVMPNVSHSVKEAMDYLILHPDLFD